MAARISAMTMFWPSLGCAWCWLTWTSWTAPASVSVAMLLCSLRDEVDDGEDEDPHHVDEVPVEADDLHDLGLGFGEPAAQRHHEQRHQHHDAEAHVHAV